MTTLVNPLDETLRPRGRPAPRLATLAGARVALLDISKPGGDVFLDRLAELLETRAGASVVRLRKPTFAKRAPAAVLAEVRQAGCTALIEALAD
jgi:hypothetical protein